MGADHTFRSPAATIARVCCPNARAATGPRSQQLEAQKGVANSESIRLGHALRAGTSRGPCSFPRFGQHALQMRPSVPGWFDRVGVRKCSSSDACARAPLQLCEVSYPRRMERVVCLSLGRTGRGFVAIAVAHGDEDEEHADDCGHARVEEEPS